MSSAFSAVGRSHSNNDRPMLERHGEKVVDALEIAREKFLLRLFHFLFLSLYDLLHLHFRSHRAIEPIDAGHIRTMIESKRWIVAQEPGDSRRVLVID